MEQLEMELVEPTTTQEVSEVFGDAKTMKAVIELMACALITVARTEQETNDEW